MTYLLVFEAIKDGKDIKRNIAAVGSLPSVNDIREAENQLKENLDCENVVITNMFEIADAEEKWQLKNIYLSYGCWTSR